MQQQMKGGFNALPGGAANGMPGQPGQMMPGVQNAAPGAQPGKGMPNAPGAPPMMNQQQQQGGQQQQNRPPAGGNPAGQPLTAQMLANAPPSMQKQMLGEKLFPA